jgi:SAM-dependent methyltransferase
MNETHLHYLAGPEWAERLRTDLLPWIDRQAGLGEDVLEIGPGPGHTTDILRRRAAHVTAVEIDGALAEALHTRLGDTNVSVVHGDAAALDFESGRFSAVTAFSALHHVPTADAQDRIFREARRVLAPGGWFFVTDARDLAAIRAGHADDTFTPLPVETVRQRLEVAGFEDVRLEMADHEIRLCARRPA